MKLTRKNAKLGILFATGSMVALLGANTYAASDTGTATATVMTPISISADTALDFGAFAPSTGGTVTIATDGARSSSGVVPSSTDTGNNGVFTVTGQASATYAITLPSDGTVTITSGGNSMDVDTFTSNPSGTGTLSGGGSQTLNVGATLTVGSGQAAGSYSGTFDVSVEYN